MAGIYVHVPFCKSKCTYCDFASYPKEIQKAELYFGCLYREATARGNQLRGTFDTVYVGGGTPSFVDPKYIVGMLKRIKEKFTLAGDAEITIEINPGTLTEEKLDAYRAAGFNRFSVGLQSADDGMLARLGRIHTLADYLKCAGMLKGENFSADVLLGLYGQTTADVERTLNVAMDSGASHISCYALTPEVGTPIYTDYLNGELPSDDETAELYEFAVENLRKRGFLRYEVSNFALPGKESRHNINYWRRGDYIGLGVAASSHIDNRRFTNTFSIDEYVKCILSGCFAEISSDTIEGEDIKSEYIMLALRTEEGFSKAEYEGMFGIPFEEEFADVLKKQGKYLDLSGGRVRIKPEFLFVQNSIICDFLK